MREVYHTDAWLRSLADAATDFVFYRYLFAPLRCEFMGRGVEAITGHPVEEFFNRPDLITSIVHPDDQHLLQAEVFEAGRPTDVRWLHRDGRVVWTRQRHVPVRDVEGAMIGIEGLAYEITEARQAEIALRASHERLVEAERLARVGHWEYSLRERRAIFSDMVYEIFGLEQGNLGSDIDGFLRRIHREDRPAIVRMSALGDGEPFEREVRVVMDDGSIRWVQIRGRVEHDEHDIPALVLGTMLDITERKAAQEAVLAMLQRERDIAEELRAVSEMKETFLTAISHEMRTPLTTLLGFSQLLERDRDFTDEQRRDFAFRISNSAKQLERLLSDVLDVDRLRRGVLEPRVHRADLAEVVQAAVDRTELGRGGRPVTIDLQPVELDLDVAWTERAVENLLRNVTKHTPPEAPAWVRVTQDDAEAWVEIEDGGPGIPADVRKAIFEPFEQGPNAPQHSPGIGLGLTLASHLVKLQGGSIELVDRSGTGCLFRMRFPLGEP